MAKYWLVGATEDEGCGTDRSGEWQDKSIWKLMWGEGEKPRYDSMLSNMRTGDRIAIKSMMGQGSPTIRIKAIGIIKEVSVDGRMVVVDWVLKGMSRIVSSHGCFGTMHGPFEKCVWTRKVFSL